MGSGCLSPAPRQGELDIEVLDNLYEDISKMNLPSCASGP